MDIKTKVTYYPLKWVDELFHIFKKTEIISPVIKIEDSGIAPFDDYNSAQEAANKINERMKDADLSII